MLCTWAPLAHQTLLGYIFSCEKLWFQLEMATILSNYQSNTCSLFCRLEHVGDDLCHHPCHCGICFEGERTLQWCLHWVEGMGLLTSAFRLFISLLSSGVSDEGCGDKEIQILFILLNFPIFLYAISENCLWMYIHVCFYLFNSLLSSGASVEKCGDLEIHILIPFFSICGVLLGTLLMNVHSCIFLLFFVPTLCLCWVAVDIRACNYRSHKLMLKNYVLRSLPPRWSLGLILKEKLIDVQSPFLLIIKNYFIAAVLLTSTQFAL